MAQIENPPPTAADAFGTSWPQLESFAEMLVAEGEIRGLIGPRELPRLWSRHILNSTAVAPFVPAGASVIDVGSGAGFPGIVLAILRPDAQVHLVEPMQRRVEWLDDVVTALVLDNVRIHRARAEELHGELEADVVTARAVAALDKLVRWCMPLVRENGVLVALKGRRVGEEISEARTTLRKLGVGVPEVHQVAVLGEESPVTVLEARRTIG